MKHVIQKSRTTGAKDLVPRKVGYYRKRPEYEKKPTGWFGKLQDKIAAHLSPSEIEAVNIFKKARTPGAKDIKPRKKKGVEEDYNPIAVAWKKFQAERQAGNPEAGKHYQDFMKKSMDFPFEKGRGKDLKPRKKRGAFKWMNPITRQEEWIPYHAKNVKKVEQKIINWPKKGDKDYLD